MHMAPKLKQAGGMPDYGNSQEVWDDGTRNNDPIPNIGKSQV